MCALTWIGLWPTLPARKFYPKWCYKLCALHSESEAVAEAGGNLQSALAKPEIVFSWVFKGSFMSPTSAAAQAGPQSPELCCWREKRKQKGRWRPPKLYQTPPRSQEIWGLCRVITLPAEKKLCENFLSCAASAFQPLVTHNFPLSSPEAQMG